MGAIASTIVVLLYLFAVGYLGYRGYKRTQTAADYLVAGRSAHPFIMALSYGATFISTSAIVGFGGVAALFGMSLLWLTFLNIFVGIFIAFVFLGGPTRRMGHHLDAHTFPELLAKRYHSHFIQVFAGLLIFFFMPLYAAAVLIGGAEFISTQFNLGYNAALIIFAIVVAAYVITGGLKGVMYTDALQGAIMFIGMAILLAWTYIQLGGPVQAHHDLTAMKDQAFVGFKAMGQQGWTAMPKFAWGDKSGQLWWIVVSTITMGVGIGVLAQPQLIVRFMTVKSKRDLNRGVLVGGVFILCMTGVAFTVGALSNLYFYKYETVKGKLLGVTEKADVIAKKERGIEAKIPCTLLHIDTTGSGMADTTVVYRGVGKAEAIMPKAEIAGLAPGAKPADLIKQDVAVHPRSASFTRAVVQAGFTPDGTPIYAFNTDSIIPTFITSALPGWFGLVFLLTLLSAAMSTLSSQFHTMGTAVGRDVYVTITGRHGSSVAITRAGVIIGIIIALILGNVTRGGYIVARATSIFFGLCAAAFLPAFVGGLFFRRANKAGAIASMIAGALVSGFWLLFVKDAEARAVGLCFSLFGKYSLFETHPTWPVVDPLFVSLPFSLIVMIVVSLLTRPMDKAHVDYCFGGPKPDGHPATAPAAPAQTNA